MENQTNTTSRITWSTVLMTLLLVELMILPKLQLGDITMGYPIRFTYIVCLILGVKACFCRRDIMPVVIPFMGMVCMFIVGSFIGRISFGIEPTGKVIAIFVYIMLFPTSIAVGSILHSGKMPYRIVLWCLILAVILTILMTYIPAAGNILIRVYGISTRVSGSYLGWRSPGIWNGVNSSAGVVNIMVIFLVVGTVARPPKIGPVGMVIAILLAGIHHIILASKAGILLLFLIVIFYLSTIIKRLSRMILVIALLLIPLGIFVFKSDDIRRSVGQVDYLFRTTESVIGEKGESKSVYSRKQLITMAFARFARSPIAGSGFGRKYEYPFRSVSYHNDYLIVLVAGGLIGISAFLLSIWRISQLNILFVLPFVFPGMTNTFLFNPSAICIYGLLVGHILSSQKDDNVPVVSDT